jgi:predicted transcriptional regulator YdeE
LIVCSLLTLAAEYAVTDMKPRVVEKLDGFTVVGIAARTNNAKESTPDSAIGKLWHSFFNEGILNEIPNKVDANTIAVYTDYARDKDGDYTYVLGAKVKSPENLPAGMVAVQVLPGRYAVFTSEKGPAYKVVPDAWRKIWAVPKSDANGNRTYKTDFEVYDQRAADPQKSQVDLYVGLK